MSLVLRAAQWFLVKFYVHCISSKVCLELGRILLGDHVVSAKLGSFANEPPKMSLSSGLVSFDLCKNFLLVCRNCFTTVLAQVLEVESELFRSKPVFVHLLSLVQV